MKSPTSTPARGGGRGPSRPSAQSSAAGSPSASPGAASDDASTLGTSASASSSSTERTPERSAATPAQAPSQGDSSSSAPAPPAPAAQANAGGPQRRERGERPDRDRTRDRERERDKDRDRNREAPSARDRDAQTGRDRDRSPRDQRGGGSGNAGGSASASPGTSHGGNPSRRTSDSGGGQSNARRQDHHRTADASPRRPRSDRDRDRGGAHSGAGGTVAMALSADDDDASEKMSFLGDVAELTKARLTLMVLLTTLVGFYLGMPEGTVSIIMLGHTLFGTGLVAAAASALNQYREREFDAQMPRTEDRPLARGRLSANDVAPAAIAAALFGTLWLGILVNWMAAALAILTLLIYVFVYTPLKRITPLNTIIGAVPGAIPPVIGWAAARNSLDLQALALFFILVLWQMPHFLAIAWLYRDEYSGAGFKMSSLGDHSGGRTAGSAVFYSLLLIPVSMTPSFLGTCHIAFAFIAFALSTGFAVMCVRFFSFPVNLRARQLFLASIFYLPLILIAAVLTKTG